VSTFIDEGRAAGAVLVHCYAGVSRSAALVAAHLMTRLGLSLTEAMARVRAARPEADPNPGFVAQLRRLEGRLRTPPGNGAPLRADEPGEPGAEGAAAPGLAAGPVGESMEMLKRAALERMAELFRQRGVYVGGAGGAPWPGRPDPCEARGGG